MVNYLTVKIFEVPLKFQTITNGPKREKKTKKKTEKLRNG